MAETLSKALNTNKRLNGSLMCRLLLWMYYYEKGFKRKQRHRSFEWSVKHSISVRLYINILPITCKGIQNIPLCRGTLQESGLYEHLCRNWSKF